MKWENKKTIIKSLFNKHLGNEHLKYEEMFLGSFPALGVIYRKDNFECSVAFQNKLRPQSIRELSKQYIKKIKKRIK